MALSPWHISESLELREVALMLRIGSDISGLYAGKELLSDGEMLVVIEWEKEMLRALQRGELHPFKVDGADFLEASPEVLKSLTLGYRIELTRQEANRWLKSRGATDDDIPEALRVMPAKEPDEPDNGDLHPRREATYQRIIAALVALQYGHMEIEEPFKLANEVLNDCQVRGIKTPASRTKLGELFKQLPPVQKADLD